jgi:hypothetical protein
MGPKSRPTPGGLAPWWGDDAACELENIGIEFGEPARSDHAIKTLSIIEHARAATLGNPDKPADGVYLTGIHW